MTDAAISNAIARKIELIIKIKESEARTKRLKTQLADVERFIVEWQKFSGQSVPESVCDSEIFQNEANLSRIGTDSPRRKNSLKEDVGAASREILSVVGRPLSRRELLAVLKEKGFTIEGVDPEMVLSTMLWRVGNKFGIIRLKSGGYALDDVPDKQTDLTVSWE